MAILTSNIKYQSPRLIIEHEKTTQIKEIRQVIKNMDEIKEFINKMANKHNLSYEEAEKLAITREYINYVSNNHCYYCEKGGGT